MDEQTRRTGLDIIGDVPWGTHSCHFYRTKHELIDVLVPYFKAGLESNEFCMWVTSDPLVEQDACKAMSEAMPGFDRYLKTGQIEIMPHDRWYLKDGVFDSERVLRGWVDKLDSALSRGYSGLRLTGNTAWLEKKDRASFADYEAAVTSVIGKHKMVALCSHLLEKCSAAEVIEAARSHAFAIISHNGNPELVEGALYRQTRETLAQLRASEERNRLLVENATEGIVVIQDGEIVFANSQVTEVIGDSEPGQPSRPITELIHPDDRQMVMERLLGVLGSQGRPGISSFRIIDKEGNERWLEANMALFTWNEKPAILALLTDITERKQAEDALQRQEQHFRALVEHSSDMIVVVDHGGTITYENPAVEQAIGLKPEERIGASIFEHVHPEDMQAVAEAFKELWQNPHAAARQAEIRLWHKAGTWRIFEATGSNLVRDSLVEAVIINLRDITKHKKVQDALRASEGKHRNLYEAMAQGVVYQDADGRIISANLAAQRILGLSIDQMMGKTSVDPRWKAIHEDGSDFLGDTHPAMIALKTGQSNRDIMGVFNPDEGCYRWIVINAVPQFRTREEHPYQVFTTFEDITDRKQAEEALRKSHQLLNDTGEMAKVGGWELDLSTNEVSWTEETCRIHGVGPGYRAKLEEALNFYAPKSRPPVEAAVKKAAETGEPFDIESLFIPRGSKEKIWVRSLGKAVYSGGKIVRLVGTFQNIDKQKRAEQALRESETRYRLQEESLSDVIWTMGTDLKYTYISPSVTRQRGYSVEEAMAQSLAENLTPASLETAMKLMVEEEAKERTGQYDLNRSITMEVEASCKNGATIWVENSVTYLRDSNGQITAYVGISRDITERKKAEEIRKTLYRRLVDVQEKERQTIARELHDEIGQPLTILKLYLDRNRPQAAGVVDPQLEEARKVLMGLIHQVRNMSGNLRPAMLDDLGLLPTLLWHFERYTRQTKISVNFRHTGLKRQLPPEVANTAYRLVQEALTNVARHAQVAEVMVYIRARRNSLVIKVRDHGIGFDLSKVAGKGIGLTGMYERALASNGTLTIESTPGTGTYLLVELPLSKGSEKEIKTSKRSGKNSAQRRSLRD